MSGPLDDLLRTGGQVSGFSLKIPCFISVYDKFRQNREGWVHQSSLSNFLEKAMLRVCEDISVLEISAFSEAIIQSALSASLNMEDGAVRFRMRDEIISLKDFLNAIAAFLESFISSRGIESTIAEDLRGSAARANYEDGFIADESAADGGVNAVARPGSIEPPLLTTPQLISARDTPALSYAGYHQSYPSLIQQSPRNVGSFVDRRPAHQIQMLNPAFAASHSSLFATVDAQDYERAELLNATRSRPGLRATDNLTRLLAQVRKQGMDILFPQNTHDKVLACIFVAVRSKTALAHRELIDLVMLVRDSGKVSQLEAVTKTKIRGVLALLKHADVLSTHGLEGTPVQLALHPYIKSFEELRNNHDNFIQGFACKNKISCTRLQVKASRCATITDFCAQLVSFYQESSWMAVGATGTSSSSSSSSSLGTSNTGLGLGLGLPLSAMMGMHSNHLAGLQSYVPMMPDNAMSLDSNDYNISISNAQHVLSDSPGLGPLSELGATSISEGSTSREATPSTSREQSPHRLDGGSPNLNSGFQKDAQLMLQTSASTSNIISNPVSLLSSGVSGLSAGSGAFSLSLNSQSQYQQSSSSSFTSNHLLSSGRTAQTAAAAVAMNLKGYNGVGLRPSPQQQQYSQSQSSLFQSALPIGNNHRIDTRTQLWNSQLPLDAQRSGRYGQGQSMQTGGRGMGGGASLGLMAGQKSFNPQHAQRAAAIQQQQLQSMSRDPILHPFQSGHIDLQQTYNTHGMGIGQTSSGFGVGGGIGNGLTGMGVGIRRSFSDGGTESFHAPPGMTPPPALDASFAAGRGNSLGYGSALRATAAAFQGPDSTRANNNLWGLNEGTPGVSSRTSSGANSPMFAMGGVGSGGGSSGPVLSGTNRKEAVLSSKSLDYSLFSGNISNGSSSAYFDDELRSGGLNQTGYDRKLGDGSYLDMNGGNVSLLASWSQAQSSVPTGDEGNDSQLSPFFGSINEPFLQCLEDDDDTDHHLFLQDNDNDDGVDTKQADMYHLKGQLDESESESQSQSQSHDPADVVSVPVPVGSDFLKDERPEGGEEPSLSVAITGDDPFSDNNNTNDNNTDDVMDHLRHPALDTSSNQPTGDNNNN
eukprot:gene864-1686_t